MGLTYAVVSPDAPAILALRTRAVFEVRKYPNEHLTPAICQRRVLSEKKIYAVPIHRTTRQNAKKNAVSPTAQPTALRQAQPLPQQSTVSSTYHILKHIMLKTTILTSG